MEFYTLDFEPAKSLFLGQLDPNLVDAFIMVVDGSSLTQATGWQFTKLTRMSVDKDLTHCIAVRELITKASAEFNEMLEAKSTQFVMFSRFEVLKALELSRDGQSVEYAFIVEYGFPSDKGMVSF
jgi:hypothetical protein